MNMAISATQIPASAVQPHEREIPSKEKEAESSRPTESPRFDEYVHADEQTSPTGIYIPSKDEEGNPIIAYDNPDDPKDKNVSDKVDDPKDKNVSDKVDDPKDKNVSDKVDDPKDKNVSDKVDEPAGDKEAQSTECICDTGKVDAEIKKLQEKQQQIQQKLSGLPSDSDERAELEKQLSSIEMEIKAKDNDAYRKQNASYTSSASE